MWREAVFFLPTALLYAENGAMWNRNLIFGGGISWNQAIRLCSRNAMTHIMSGLLEVLEWVCSHSSISSVSPAADSTSLGNSLKHVCLGESTAIVMLHQKISGLWMWRWVEPWLEHPIGWDACDIIFCFPTAEVTCCCGSTEAWHVAGGCVMRICVFSHINYHLGLQVYHLAYDLLTGVTHFKMSSKFSHFINTKTHQNELTALFWLLMSFLKIGWDCPLVALQIS